MTALSLAIPLTPPEPDDQMRLRVSLIYLWQHGYLPDLSGQTTVTPMTSFYLHSGEEMNQLDESHHRMAQRKCY
jgi:hypothetical protein